MTDIRERSTAALAEADHAVDYPTVAWKRCQAKGDHIDRARKMLAASPTLAADLDLAIAWREAVAALPEGWHGPSVAQNWLGRWYAYVYQHSEFAPDDPEISAHVSAEDHATPTEALVALAEALRERAR